MGQNLLIVGAGTYAVVAAEIAADMGVFRQIDFVDDAQQFTPTGAAVVGTTQDIIALASQYGNIVVAIGNPEVRNYMLMFGTVDQRRKRVTPGVYRGKSFVLRNRSLPPAERVQPLLKELIHEYESKKEIGRTEILDFHVRFEKICPFEDGNGRIGRLIMFKECLRHNVMPFVIDDKHRKQYLAGIKEWEIDHTILLQLADEAQERFKAQIALQKLGEYRRFDKNGKVLNNPATDDLK